MGRFSVRALMVLIVGAAVGLTALRNANVFWASVIATVVVVAVATALMGALTLRGRERYAWAGFAVFSGMYLAVAIGNVLPDRFKDYFGPTIALEQVLSEVSGDQSDPMVHERASILREIAALPESPDVRNLQQRARLEVVVRALDARIQQGRASMDLTNRWRTWLPGAANTSEFRCVGHSLFALLSGLIGTVVGRILYARRERSEARAR
jgi:hypothetical protein